MFASRSRKLVCIFFYHFCIRDYSLKAVILSICVHITFSSSHRDQGRWQRELRNECCKICTGNKIILELANAS